MSQQDPKKPQFPLMRPDKDRDRQQREGGGGEGPNGPQPPRRTPRIPTWIVAVVILALIGWYVWQFFGPSDDENITSVPYTVVTEQIDADNIRKATLGETEIRAELKDAIKFDTENEQVDQNAPSSDTDIEQTDDI